MLLLCFISCTKDTSPTSSLPQDAFQYQAFDNSGTQVISGWIQIKFIKPNEIVGLWNLSKIGNPVNIGHQVGEGKLEGSVENNELSINLNPDMLDDNVMLIGKLSDNRFEGKWNYFTKMGAISGGLFKAIKK
jgi:hypothetical protein